MLTLFDLLAIGLVVFVVNTLTAFVAFKLFVSRIETLVTEVSGGLNIGGLLGGGPPAAGDDSPPGADVEVSTTRESVEEMLEEDDG